MNVRSTLVIAITALAVNPAGVQAAGDYTFTKVIDGGGDISGFSPFFSFNDKGQVAVLATRTSGETEILVGDGGAVRTIADTSSGDFSSLGNPQINNAGTVAFRGSTSSEGGIFADSESGVHLLVNYSGYYNNYGFGLNNNGEVAFIAQKGFPAEASGIFLSDGTSIQQLADVSGPIKDFSSNGPVLNDAGSAAFRAVLDSGRGDLQDRRHDPHDHRRHLRASRLDLRHEPFDQQLGSGRVPCPDRQRRNRYFRGRWRAAHHDRRYLRRDREPGLAFDQ